MAFESDSGLTRLSMSLPTELSHQLDTMVQQRGLASRSSLLSELIKNAVVDHEKDMDEGVVISGSITMIYDASSGKVGDNVAKEQRNYLDNVISCQRISLDPDRSLEVLIVKGTAKELRAMCDRFLNIKGVGNLQLVTSAVMNPTPVASPRRSRPKIAVTA